MKVDELLRLAGDSLSIRRVFAEPYVVDGVTVIPAATVMAGGGGGTGHDGNGGDGDGAGFGMRARATGAYVIRGSDVRWRPAVDVNRLITVIGAVTVVYLLRHRDHSRP
jgi:uncharacterized spore protein YtfJ